MKQKITAEKALPEIGAYSNAIRCGNQIFVSGQLPVNPETGEMPRTLQEQTKQVIENVRNILADAGATLDNVVKTTVLLQEMCLFSEMNAVYAQWRPCSIESPLCHIKTSQFHWTLIKTH